MSWLDDAGDELPAVARRAIAAWLETGRHIDVREPSAPTAPAFVTLRDSEGELRGCIGSLRAVAPDVVAETARIAVLAASEDPRFPPLERAELPGVRIEVSVLLPEEPVASAADLDPQRYGVVVRDGLGRHGVLLPGVDGIRDAATQLSLVRAKAGIRPQAEVELSRFEVRKFVEAD